MATETLLAAALRYAAAGIPVFPLHDVSSGTCSCQNYPCASPGKHPRTHSGLRDGTTDEAAIAAWWGKWPQANIGLAMGQGIAVLDIDGPDGEASLERLMEDRAFVGWLDTYEVKTPRGTHLYFAIPDGVRVTNRNFGKAYPKLDVRGEGGYVVAPPSVGLGGPYVLLHDIDFAEWPTALLPPAAPEREEPGSVAHVACERAENALERAAEKLRTVPAAIQGQNGSGACFTACAEIFRYGIDATEALALVEEVYNPRCVPPWSRAELEHKVADALTSELARTDPVVMLDAVLRGLKRARDARGSDPDGDANAELAAESGEISDDTAWRLCLKKTSNAGLDELLKAVNLGHAVPPSELPKIARGIVYRTKGRVGVAHAIELVRSALGAVAATENALDDSTTENDIVEAARDLFTTALAEYTKKQAAKDEKLAHITNRFAYVVPLERYFYKHGEVWDTGSPVTIAGITNALRYEGFSNEDIKAVLDAGTFLRAHDIDCIPGGDAIVEFNHRAALNCYVPPKIDPAPGACPSVDRILGMLTGGDAAGVEWLKNWTANLIQNPGERGMVAPVMYSRHTGTGKTTYGTILRNIIGTENCSEIGVSQLSGSFNSYFAKSLFVVANEIFTSEKQQDQANRMKPLITDETVAVNTKGIKEYSVPNRMTWYFTSNSKTPVRLEGETDRRYSIFNSGVPDEEYRAFLDGIWSTPSEFSPEMKAEVAAFAQQMLDWTVDKRAAMRPYDNEARAELAEVTKASEDSFLELVADIGPIAAVTDYRPEHWEGVRKDPKQWNFGERGVAQDDFYGAYQTYCKRTGRHWINKNRFTRAVKEAGLVVDRAPGGTRPWTYSGWSAEVLATPSSGKLLSIHPAGVRPEGDAPKESPKESPKEYPKEAPVPGVKQVQHVSQTIADFSKGLGFVSGAGKGDK